MGRRDGDPCFFCYFFGISLDLDKFLTLRNANIFVFSSLNRNFALTLHPKLYNYDSIEFRY